MKITSQLLFILLLFLSKTIIAQPSQCMRVYEKEAWRVLSDSGKYKEALKILFDSVEHSNKTNNHANYWHIGQLYALNNNNDTAIYYLRKSTNFIVLLTDKEWRWYYKGTIAFLKKDKEKLHTYYSKLWSKREGYYYNNACFLKALYENFNKPYIEAYRVKCN